MTQACDAGQESAPCYLVRNGTNLRAVGSDRVPIIVENGAVGMRLLKHYDGLMPGSGCGLSPMPIDEWYRRFRLAELRAEHTLRIQVGCEPIPIGRQPDQRP